MESKKFSVPVELSQVKITDAFWKREQELVRTEVIPYQWEALNDRVPGASPSFCMRNFKVAGRLMREKRGKKEFVPPVYSFRGFNALPDPEKGMEDDKFYGFVFQDSDFAKWIEAVGYSLTNHPDEQLEKIADEAIDIVCAAQADNGYLDTYYIINGMDRIFTNLRDHHELYCFGHLVEGAVAYYQATGKDKLLNAARRYGDFICEHFGPEDGKCKGYPGHEIAEMALVRLYEVTGDMKYLNLSSFFIDQRGSSPYYFGLEEQEWAQHEGREYKGDPEAFGKQDYYHQAHKPVREQEEAVGHAVRAVYLYSGMADVARIRGDEELYRACRRLWDSIVDNKLYITGGIGGTHVGEAFSLPYDLPNDTAYSETCAAIGLVFFARRMLEIEADRKYGDVMELALYNTVLAGMALDGKSFFYVNPLEVNPRDCARDERKWHVKSNRQKWFGCACCPPNIARMVSSLGSYIYTKGNETLYTHLYAGSQVQLKDGLMEMEVQAGIPWGGQVKVQLHGEQAVQHTLAFRIPGWTVERDVKVVFERKGTSPLTITLAEGKAVLSSPKEETPVNAWVEKGYLYLEGIWQEGDSLTLDMPMPMCVVESHTQVRENQGKVALMRGPICYCMEEADNGKNLQLLSVQKEALLDADGKIRLEKNVELGHEVVLLKVPGSRRTEEAAENVNKEAKGYGALYHAFKEPCSVAEELTFLPYYAWNNRGEGEMTVWVSYH